jgi:hypothetical protein
LGAQEEEGQVYITLHGWKPIKGGGTMERDQKIAAIISYVEANKDENGSAYICNRILGYKDRITNEVVNELHARLGRAKEEELDNCLRSIT